MVIAVFTVVRLAAGLALAAGQRSMHIGAAEYPHPKGVAFEVVGVDFLVDSALRPWLLEFNAVPSMARQVVLQSFLLLAFLPQPRPLCALAVMTLCTCAALRKVAVSCGCGAFRVQAHIFKYLTLRKLAAVQNLALQKMRCTCMFACVVQVLQEENVEGKRDRLG